MNPKGVSILMPLYNGVEFLQDSVPSVMWQTWDGPIELIIGVNGYKNRDNRVHTEALRWIQNSCKKTVRVLRFTDREVRGKSQALNAMIPFAQYSYVALLDVDDIWLPDKLAKQIPLLEEGYSVVGSRCIYFSNPGENGKPKNRSLDGIVPAIPLGDISSFDFTHVNPIINSSVVLKKELCQWNDEWDGVEDYDLWLRLKKNPVVTFWNAFEVLVKHRIHEQSAYNSKGNHLRVEDLLAFHRTGVKTRIETEVFRIMPKPGCYYETAVYTKKTGKWPNEKYFTLDTPGYVGKFIRHVQIGDRNETAHYDVFDKNGEEIQVNYTADGKTCYREVEPPPQTVSL